MPFILFLFLEKASFSNLPLNSQSGGLILRSTAMPQGLPDSSINVRCAGLMAQFIHC